MKRNGFTLIEMIMTTLILSLLVITGGMVFQYFQDNWQRTKQRFAQTQTEYTAWQLTERTLYKTFPWLVVDKQQFGFYFLGRKEGFTAITHSAMQQPDSAAVYRLFREELSNGVSQLVYEEALLQGITLQSAEQELPFNFRLVLLRTEQPLRFEYYGWPNLEERQKATDLTSGLTFEPASWFDEYDGLTRRQHPLVIQVNIGTFSWPIQVHDTSEALLRSRTDPGI